MLRRLMVLVWALFLVTSVRAEDLLPISVSAVNVAAEQRMLSQRVAKGYVQMGLNVVPETARRQIDEAVGRFEGNLERLRPVAERVPAAAPSYWRLVQQWAALRAAAEQPVAPEAAMTVSRQSLAVLETADLLTQSLVSASGSEVGRNVNLAGRQRMLSQRVVKAYMLYSWGVGGTDSRQEMDLAVREFTLGLGTLSALSGNTPEMRIELEEIGLQWEWLQAALSAEGALSYRLVAAEAADSILIATDRLTRLYEQAGGR